MATKQHKFTQAEKAKILDALLNAGVVTNDTLTKGIIGKQEPKKLGSVKDTKGNTIEITTWYDKDGKEYVSQTKCLPDGTRTKGFAIDMPSFKKYVSTLNSVADKMKD